MRGTVLVSSVMMLREQERFSSELRDLGYDPVFPEVSQFMDEAQCLEYAGVVDFWLSGDDQISASVLEAYSPRLAGIAKWGTGIDSIDLRAAERLGIPVLNVPAAFRDAVAEVALAYMLCLSRHVVTIDSAVRAGAWPKPVGLGLAGRTCGVVGLGAIGQAIAVRAKSFGMTVIGFDPYLHISAVEGVELYAELDGFLEKSDTVCLACNATAENYQMIGEHQFSRMKPGATLINVARGQLVDEKALIDALASGRLGGAGLDVYEAEPLQPDHPLRTLPNIIFGSHNANNQHAAVEYVHSKVLENLKKLNNRPL